MSTSSARTIAVFTKNRLNPAYHGARLGAERTAARLGMRVEHYVPQQADDLAGQIALIERALARRPAAFIFVPVHATALDEHVRRVRAAGIPLFNVINRLRSAEDYVTFVGSDDVSLAFRVAQRLLDAIGPQAGVVVLEGAPATVTSRDRVRGFRAAIEACPGVRLLASSAGAFLRDEGREAMGRILRAHPHIDGVLAANDDMALGAIDALAAAGRRSRVIGINAVPAAVQAVESGTLLATADFDAFAIASIATQAAARFLDAERVPREILLPVQVVDRSNCARFGVAPEARELPRWADVVA